MVENSHFSPLQHQINKTIRICNGNTCSWKERFEVLMELQEFFNTTTFSTDELENMHTLLEPVINPLILQLRDARSTLVKTTCQTVSVLGTTLGSYFNDVTTLLLPTLLDLTYVTIKVISNSGKECIENLIQHCRFDIKPLINAATGKNASSRICAISSLHLILQIWSKEDVDPLRQQYLQVIRMCVHDANGCVRAHGRATLVKMSELWPQYLETMAEIADRSSRNTFLKEFPDSEFTRLLVQKYGPITPKGSAIKKKKTKSRNVGIPDVKIYETPSKAVKPRRLHRPNDTTPPRAESEKKYREKIELPRRHASEEKVSRSRLARERAAKEIENRRNLSIVEDLIALAQIGRSHQNQKLAETVKTKKPILPVLEKMTFTENFSQSANFITTEQNKQAAAAYVEAESEQYKLHTMLGNEENISSVEHIPQTPDFPKQQKPIRTDERIRRLYQPMANLTLDDDARSDCTKRNLDITLNNNYHLPTVKKLASYSGWLFLSILIIFLSSYLSGNNPADVPTVKSVPPSTMPTCSLTNELSNYRQRQYDSMHLHLNQLLHQANFESKKVVSDTKAEVTSLLQEQLNLILQEAEKNALEKASIVLEKAEIERQQIIRNATELAQNIVDSAKKEAADLTKKLKMNAQIPKLLSNASSIEEEKQVERFPVDTNKDKSNENVVKVVSQRISTQLNKETQSNDHSNGSDFSFWSFVVIVIGGGTVAVFYVHLQTRKTSASHGGWTVVSEPASEATQKRIREIKARRLSLKRPAPLQTRNFYDYGSYTNKENMSIVGKDVQTPVRRSRRIYFSS